jgi:hypothetical protein
MKKKRTGRKAAQRIKKVATVEQLKDVCLHCAFFSMHGDKWPEWKPSDENEGTPAFNDLVRSTVKIVAEVFTMLDSVDQMQFMRQVMERYMQTANEPETRH